MSSALGAQVDERGPLRMEAETTFDFPHSIVLDTDGVTTIWGLLESHVGRAKGVARCSDGLVREFTTIEELTSYENARTRSIRSLSFSAASERGEAKVRLAWYGTPARVEVRAEEMKLIRRLDDLRRCLDGLRPWWSWASRIVRPSSPFILVGALAPTFALIAYVDRGGKTPDSAVVAVGAACLGLLLSALIVFGAHTLMNQCFPTNVFAVGHGSRRNEVHEKGRWLALTVVFSLLVGLFLLVV